jgi:hypothetical protein
VERGYSEAIKTIMFGHFVYGDKVKSIVDLRLTGLGEEDKTVLIEWEERRCGFKPENSMLALSEFSYYKPLEAKLLLKRRELGE